MITSEIYRQSLYDLKKNPKYLAKLLFILIVLNICGLLFTTFSGVPQAGYWIYKLVDIIASTIVLIAIYRHVIYGENRITINIAAGIKFFGLLLVTTLFAKSVLFSFLGAVFISAGGDNILFSMLLAAFSILLLILPLFILYMPAIALGNRLNISIIKKSFRNYLTIVFAVYPIYGLFTLLLSPMWSSSPLFIIFVALFVEPVTVLIVTVILSVTYDTVVLNSEE